MVVLKNGHYWIRIHFSTVKLGSDTEGECYSHSVEVALPGKGAVAARDLMALERGRYLVRVTDNNDGTPDGTTAYNLNITGLTQWPQMKVV